MRIKKELSPIPGAAMAGHITVEQANQLLREMVGAQVAELDAH